MNKQKRVYDMNAYCNKSASSLHVEVFVCANKLELNCPQITGNWKSQPAKLSDLMFRCVGVYLQTGYLCGPLNIPAMPKIMSNCITCGAQYLNVHWFIHISACIVYFYSKNKYRRRYDVQHGWKYVKVEYSC